MRGWLRAVLRELRHGVCLGGLLAMGVLVAVLLWTSSGSWGTYWNALGMTVRDNMIVLSPFAVVLGVWQGGRARRSEVEELFGSTRRSYLARHSAEVVALGLACFAGVLLGTASAGWTIIWVGGYGTWVASAYVVGVLPALLASVALGHLVGTIFPWRVVAPLAGVLIYVALGFLGWRNDERPILFGGGYLGGVDLAAFDTDAWVLGILFCLLATLGLLGLGAIERRPARSTGWIGAAAAGFGLVVLTAPAALAAMDAGRADYPQVDRAVVVCTTDSGPKVCVMKEAQHQLDEATLAARAMLDTLHGIPGAPTWAGPYRSGDDKHRLTVDTTPSTPWGEPSDPATDFVSLSTVFSPVECPVDPHTHRLPGEKDGSAWAGGDLVSQWLGDRVEPTGASPTLQRRFTASSDTQKRLYAGRLITAARECDPAAARAAVEVLGPP